MAEIKIEANGWTAGLAVLAILAVGGAAFFLKPQALPDSALDQLRLQLAGSYVGDSYQAVTQRLDAGDRAGAEQAADEARRRTEIEFGDIAIKGSSTEVIARIEILVGGQVPPDGVATRYYRFKRTLATDWRLDREVNSREFTLRIK